jgi:hypothetical protein
VWAPPRDPEPGSLFAPHEEGGRFFNPWARQARRISDFFPWRL